ncbi:hypothetical protein [Paraburkholderia caribensis]|uniref:hypothetical protein n=1 Tax=Paraburkholderia caribensis TaxID=75105 RepID=UPI00209181BC|nr:hypothetical protein [Paraburkholderia caribensis]MCO4879041.1 hypothetical protein [Paraburkholderia caribensis]
MKKAAPSLTSLGGFSYLVKPYPIPAMYEYNAPETERESIAEKCNKREIWIYGKLLRRETLRKMMKPKPIHSIPPSERPRTEPISAYKPPKYRKFKDVPDTDKNEIRALKDSLSLHELMERFNLSARSINDILLNRVRHRRKRKST